MNEDPRWPELNRSIPRKRPEALRNLLRELPPLNIIRTVALAENHAEPFLRFGTSVLTEQQLSAHLRELAILRVARLSGAEYEWVQHVPIALDAGASPGASRCARWRSTQRRLLHRRGARSSRLHDRRGEQRRVE